MGLTTLHSTNVHACDLRFSEFVTRTGSSFDHWVAPLTIYVVASWWPDIDLLLVINICFKIDL